MKQTLRIFFLSSFLFMTILSRAQDDGFVPKPRPVHPAPSKADILERLYYGGNIGFNFSQIGYFADVSPLIGYKINEKLSAGVYITYQHYDFTTPYGEFKNDIYGAGLFARYMITPNIFAHVQGGVLNGEWIDQQRFDIYPLYVGAGYRNRIGSRASFYAMLLYDLNHSIYSPSDTPWYYTFGFGFGF
jgi:hypothetical protein